MVYLYSTIKMIQGPINIKIRNNKIYRQKITATGTPVPLTSCLNHLNSASAASHLSGFGNRTYHSGTLLFESSKNFGSVFLNCLDRCICENKLLFIPPSPPPFSFTKLQIFLRFSSHFVFDCTPVITLPGTC